MKKLVIPIPFLNVYSITIACKYGNRYFKNRDKGLPAV